MSKLSMPDIPSLTGLRFFAAFSIVFNHLLLGFVERGNVIFGPMLQACGVLGMNVFFVLSGFIIHYNYHQSLSSFTLKSNYAFFVARFSRLYPLYLFILLLEVFTSDYILKFGFHGLINVFFYYITMTQSWFFIESHGTFLAHVLPRASITWSIGTEMLMYCTYPIILWAVLCDKFGHFLRIVILIFIVLAVSIGIRWLFNNPYQVEQVGVSVFGIPSGDANKANNFWSWLTFFSPYVRIGEFLIGVLVAHVFLQRHSLPLCRAESIILQILGVSSIIFVIATFLPNPYALDFVRDIFLNVGYIPFLAIIIFCCARLERSWMTRFFAWPLFVRWGEWSYSVYLFHIFLVHAATHEAGPGWLQVARIFGYFIVILACSKVLYTFIEMPWRKKTRNFLMQLPDLIRFRFLAKPLDKGMVP